MAINRFEDLVNLDPTVGSEIASAAGTGNVCPLTPPRCAPMEPISDALRQAVDRSFAPPERDYVLDVLAAEWSEAFQYVASQWPGAPEYVRTAIIVLADGDTARLKQLVWAAQCDFRDVLMLLERPKDLDARLTRRKLAHRYRALGLNIPDILKRYADLPVRAKASPARKRGSKPETKRTRSRRI